MSTMLYLQQSEGFYPTREAEGGHIDANYSEEEVRKICTDHDFKLGDSNLVLLADATNLCWEEFNRPSELKRTHSTSLAGERESALHYCLISHLVYGNVVEKVRANEDFAIHVIYNGVGFQGLVNMLVKDGQTSSELDFKHEELSDKKHHFIYNSKASD